MIEFILALIASIIIAISLTLICFKIYTVLDYKSMLKNKITMNIEGYILSLTQSGWSYCKVEIYKDDQMVYESRKSESIYLKTHGKKEEIRKFYLEALEEYKEYNESWLKCDTP